MKVVVRDSTSGAAAEAVLAFKGEKDEAAAKGAPAAIREAIATCRRAGLYRGERGEVTPLVAPGAGDRTVFVVGLGDEDSLDAETVRRAFGALAKRAVRTEARRVELSLDSGPCRRALRALGTRRAVTAIVEGAILGSYQYLEQKSGAARKGARRVTLGLRPGKLGKKDREEARDAAREATLVAEGVVLARDLANEPANELDPAALASRARSLARAEGLRCRVLGPRELREEGMGGILGVGQGSDRPPRLIVLEHSPRKRSRPTLVLVGKAVTFDTGGISIKPARGMEDMKFDMAGGAAVIGAMGAIARAKVPVRVVGLVPAAENHISGSATRPGDVLEMASGTTVEVINTDAEGRLILADALHYARRYEPDGVVDVATLTGACVVALGTAASGLFGNDDDWVAQVEAAATESGERVWRLPIFPEHEEAMKSQVADLRNSAGRNAGASTAAAFLGRFTGGLRWAHLDIAGTGWTPRAAGYHAIGATGVGVRLLVELARSMARSGGSR